MTTIALNIEDDIAASLDRISNQQGRKTSEVLQDLVRRFVERQTLETALRDPALQELYRELAAEDIVLAEAGLGEYQRTLDEIDRK